MKIIIIGLGTIGKTILKSLSGEGHTITIIDQDKDKIESLIEKYDVYGVVGNGACMDIQREAHAEDADLAIVMTHSDELNVFACLVAKKVGVRNTIARVRNPLYRDQIMNMQDALGISIIVNPERETANEIFNLINLPSVAQIEHFAGGRVLLVEVVAEKSSSLVGETLISLGKRLTSKVLICAVKRGDDVIIPTGTFTTRQVSIPPRRSTLCLRCVHPAVTELRITQTSSAFPSSRVRSLGALRQTFLCPVQLRTRFVRLTRLRSSLTA